MAMRHADAVIVGAESLSDEATATLAGLNKPVLSCPGTEGVVGEINTFYDTILEGKTEAVAE